MYGKKVATTCFKLLINKANLVVKTMVFYFGNGGVINSVINY